MALLSLLFMALVGLSVAFGILFILSSILLVGSVTFFNKLENCERQI